MAASSSPRSPFTSQTINDENNSSMKETTTSSSISKISPLILLVIIVLAIIFFLYGLVQLILWLLMKRPSSSSHYNSNRFQESARTRSLQRQLQHLFHLHDSGLDQAFINTLPVFNYQDLLGLKEPFDCAVCLCEFSEQDKLRLVPICSHAFHMNCLDTWLLSNSTCPLCRANISNNSFPLENVNVVEDSLVLSHRFNVNGDKENSIIEDNQIGDKRVFSVKLGKFRSNGLENGSTSSCSLDERRCYSMGSYQYVFCDSNLQVVLSQSYCEEDENGNVEGKRIGNRIKGESFSVSKIWLWSKKSNIPSSNTVFP
ncbi:RING-H2 finger protein ATL47-like [Vicia villosa]|uniref:RING-H2 finger protein ATL47-like n=1 Tax=Vicia villosa TaxID=3911 RepID=UPI00273ACB69|nr:RING-H2 finger protein ATL47-like [Vicia villosa]